VRISLENFNVFFIHLVVSGFPIFVTTNLLLGFDTSQGSILYRALVVIFSFIIIFNSFNKLTKIRLGLFTLFLFLYSVRLIYDLSIRSIPSPFIVPQIIYLLHFGGIIIPVTAVSFMKINTDKLNTTIFYVSFVQCFFVLIGLYLLYGTNIVQLLSERYMYTDNSVNNGGGSPLNPILVSRTGAVLFLLLLVNVLFKTKIIKSYLYIVGFILSISLILLGGSRGPLLTCIVLSIITIFFHLKNSNFKNIFVVLFVVLVVLIGLSYLIATYSESIDLVQRVNESLLNRGNVSYGREGHFNSALNQFIDNPFFGDKIFDNYSNFYPHNLLLESFMALGIFGGLIFLYINIINIIKCGKKNIINIFITFVCFSLFGFTSGAIWSSSEFWILLAVINKFRKNDFITT
jgi:hypothetical protein